MAADDENTQWAAMLSGWAVPADLVAAAPESPYFFSPAVFTDAADEALDRPDDSPSDSAARAMLPPGGVVLDVGVGAGAASVRLPAGHVIGVDPNQELLDAFVERANRRGVAATPLRGVWPDVATDVPVADVAVCHHVVYNVADLASFVLALTSRARRGVVIELTAVHPMAWMAPYWQTLHGMKQPDRPTAEDAIAVMAGLGLDLQQRRWTRAVRMIGENGPDGLARIARRLCLPADRLPELAALLDQVPPPVERDVLTVWWDRS